jgi:hypothetical protein
MTTKEHITGRATPATQWFGGPSADPARDGIDPLVWRRVIRKESGQPTVGEHVALAAKDRDVLAGIVPHVAVFVMTIDPGFPAFLAGAEREPMRPESLGRLPGRVALPIVMMFAQPLLGHDDDSAISG